MVVVGEHDARVDEDHVVAVLDDGHVLADLVEPAERDDAKAFGLVLLLLDMRVGTSPFGRVLRPFW